MRHALAASLECTALLLAAAASSSAHDLFFRAPAYVVAPGAKLSVDVLSGTFSKSENAITRDRLTDLSVMAPSGRVRLEQSAWSETEPRSSVSVTTAEPGSYVLGASLRPMMLVLNGADFTAYLKEEGIEEILALRARQKRQGEGSRERYSKYVKAIVQAGALATKNATEALGYAAEIVPETNPYSLAPGAALTVRCIVDGKPWAHKVIFAGGRKGASDVRLPQQRLVTDAAGRATLQLTAAGTWYVKFVAMTEISDPEANYESKWSTLSFAVGEKP